MKIKFTISYDGSLYYGSQIQPEYVTIQAKIDKIFTLLNIKTNLEFSGRTDRGVHAFRQVISCIIPPFWSDLKKLQITLNKMLPNSIYVRDISKVNENFHARFSAKNREYRYLISAKKLTPFNQNYLGYYENINSENIQSAIKILQGIHDFEYFSKKGSDPVSTIREIYNITFYKYKNLYIFRFKANGYLRSQIRIMIDFIMKISSGKLSIEQLEQQLNKEKLISWTLASPNGLYLSKIGY